ncbi:hypothetical protein HK097_006859, partial [Rhizophlyctis rosea]
GRKREGGEVKGNSKKAKQSSPSNTSTPSPIPRSDTPATNTTPKSTTRNEDTTPPAQPQSTERTAYALARPQRLVAVKRKYIEDPLDLHQPLPYTPTQPQPFQLTISPTAIAIMDLHAHLLACEVIGYLAGSFDASTHTLHIKTSIPIMMGQSTHVTVDADPESMLRAVQEAEGRGLK